MSSKPEIAYVIEFLEDEMRDTRSDYRRAKIGVYLATVKSLIEQLSSVEREFAQYRGEVPSAEKRR